MAAFKFMLNQNVTDFLNQLNHPLREEIEALRMMILSSASGLTENIKWNGPNYSFDDQDRITMKIQPPKAIQIIFHRGAKVQEQPESRLIKDNSGILQWKENDRAIATFKTMADITYRKEALAIIIRDWIASSL